MPRIRPLDNPAFERRDFVYCLSCDHKRYSRFVKIGCTSRSPEIRAFELSQKWYCQSTVEWTLHVYSAIEAEQRLHSVLERYRCYFEFFDLSPARALRLSQRILTAKWRDTEDSPPPVTDLEELSRDVAAGYMLPHERLEFAPDGPDESLEEDFPVNRRISDA